MYLGLLESRRLLFKQCDLLGLKDNDEKSLWKMWQVYASFQVSGKRLPKNFSKTDPFVSSPLLGLLSFSPLPNLFSIQSCLLTFHSVSSPSHFIILILPLTSVPLKVLLWSQALHIWCEMGGLEVFIEIVLRFVAFISLFFSIARKWIHHLSCHQNSWTFLWWKKNTDKYSQRKLLPKLSTLQNYG